MAPIKKLSIWLNLEPGQTSVNPSVVIVDRLLREVLGSCVRRYVSANIRLGRRC